MIRLMVVVLVLAVPLCAQDRKLEPKAKKTPFDNIPGYKVHMLAGFTVIIHEDVEANERSDMKRKPLECLELELKNVAGLMNSKAVDALRKIPVWAEWDEVLPVGNGRPGQSYASYYGGNQRNLLGQGMHPLKAKCVVLHLTKQLAKSYQEKDRPETLVMLHELAHAVHDQMLGMQHGGVKAAYAQAMARKLYDKSLYIATNEAEFFAEASCAFLDRLDYVPKNRAALKAHDPETYKLMESVWGKAAVTGIEATKGKRPPSGSGEFDMIIRPENVKWARAITGDAFKLANAKGRVIFLAYVHSEQGAILNRLRAWNDEYEPYGLSLVVANGEYGRSPAESAAVYQKLNLSFAIHDTTFIPLKNSTQLRAEKPGHGILFAASGECLFRGAIDDATIYLREALGQRLVDSLALTEVPKSLKPAIDALSAGESLVAVAVKAQPFITSSDPFLAEPARKLVTVITEPATKAMEAAIANRNSDPLESFIVAERIAARFKGTSAGSKANTLANGLLATKEVQAELKARRDFEAVKKLETYLTSQAGSFEPRSASFQSKHGTSLVRLKEACELMRKKHPNAKVTQKAAAIAREYGVE